MNDELINLLREIRPSFSDVGSRDVDTRRKQNQIDRAIELLARQPAAIDKEALLRKIRITCESRFVKMGDDYALGANQVARDVVRLLDASPLANEASKPAPSVEQDERGAFEAWARNEFDIDAGTPLFREGKGYMGLAINAAWRAWRGSWQARAASTSANVAQVSDCTCGAKNGDAHNEACPVTHEIRHLFAMSGESASAKANVAQGAGLTDEQISRKGDLYGSYSAADGYWSFSPKEFIDCVRALLSDQVANVAQGAESADSRIAAVRVCEISDIECSQGCGTGACKREVAAPAQTALTDDARLIDLFDVLMRQKIETSDESYLSLKCVGVPPTKVEFVAAVQCALTAAQSASASEGKMEDAR